MLKVKVSNIKTNESKEMELPVDYLHEVTKYIRTLKTRNIIVYTDYDRGQILVERWLVNRRFKAKRIF